VSSPTCRDMSATFPAKNIQMAVSFLTTPVKAPDEDDWGKLVILLKYINGTQYMKLILSADEMNFTVHW
jgi:hypothetical protein